MASSTTVHRSSSLGHVTSVSVHCQRPPSLADMFVSSLPYCQFKKRIYLRCRLFHLLGMARNDTLSAFWVQVHKFSFWFVSLPSSILCPLLFCIPPVFLSDQRQRQKDKPCKAWKSHRKGLSQSRHIAFNLHKNCPKTTREFVQFVTNQCVPQ